MPEVVVNGVRIHYQRHGSAGPDMVLLHAVTSNLAVWLFTGLVDALAVDHRVTLFDFRGHGASERPPTGYTSADMADDFAGLHRELGLGPAYLVGHSFGGVVGLHAAVLHPECVAGVILSDSFFPGLKHIEPNFGRANVWEDLRETYRKVDVDLGPAVDFTRLFQATAELSAGQLKALEELVGPFGKGWLRQLPRLAETTCGDDVLAEDGLTAGRIAGVTCPVVALYDEFSPFRATCRWLEANVSRCTAEIIPAAKHLALVENPAGFTDAVRRHLNRLTGKAA
jgi:3-oxoadipate enol-lactonase